VQWNYFADDMLYRQTVASTVQSTVFSANCQIVLCSWQDDNLQYGLCCTELRNCMVRRDGIISIQLPPL